MIPLIFISGMKLFITVYCASDSPLIRSFRRENALVFMRFTDSAAIFSSVSEMGRVIKLDMGSQSNLEISIFIIFGKNTLVPKL